MGIIIKYVIAIALVLLNLFLCFRIVKEIKKHCRRKTQTDGSCQCDKEPMVKLFILIEAVAVVLTIVLFKKFL